jgi:hypothetical protein
LSRDTATRTVAERERFLLMWGANQIEKSQAVIGISTAFRAAGPVLRDGPRRESAAQFYDGLWRRRRKSPEEYSLLWTETLAIVRFEDLIAGKELTTGPFDMVSFVADTIYVDREYSQPIASLDHGTGQWRLHADGSHWPEVVIIAVNPKSLIPAFPN